MTEKYDYCSSVPSWGLKFCSGLLLLSEKKELLYGVSMQSSTKVCRTLWQMTQKLWSTKT